MWVMDEVTKDSHRARRWWCVIESAWYTMGIGCRVSCTADSQVTSCFHSHAMLSHGIQTPSRIHVIVSSSACAARSPAHGLNFHVRRLASRQTSCILRPQAVLITPPHLSAQAPNAASPRPRARTPMPSSRPPCFIVSLPRAIPSFLDVNSHLLPAVDQPLLLWWDSFLFFDALFYP